MAEEKKSFWSRPLVEVLGGQDRNEMGKKTEKVGATKLLKYEQMVVTLNNCMPADLYFRTKYTIAGYKLYLFSSAKMAGLVLDVDIEKNVVLDKEGAFLCKPDELSEYLSKQSFTTVDETDDIDYEGGSDGE